MKAGNMDRRISIQRGSVVDDGFSSSIEEWNDIAANLPAEVNPISDGERWRAGEVGAHVTDRFVVRWQPALADLNPKDRVLYDGRIYDISGVKETGRRQGFEITASARSDR